MGRGRRRPLPGARLLALGLLVGLTTGCATKRDLRDLRNEVNALRARQDTLFVQLAQQNRQILDSVREGNELALRVRGDLGRQLLALEQQLIQIQELAGQSFGQINQLKARLDSRAQELASQPTGPDAVPGAGGVNIEELYAIGTDQLQRGNATTARRAFEQILREAPAHARAPDAQFQIAESYYLEKNHERALTEFDRVVELFPASTRAPDALFRAGVIAREQGNISRARRYFEQVVNRYPNSDAAGPARERLRELPKS